MPTKLFLVKTYELEKIKDKVENVKTDLGFILSVIHSDMGFKNEIDQFTKQDLGKMILSHFNTLSFEEIYKAFELERYSLYDEKTDHFQLFDANYVSTILNKYKKWKIEQKKLLNIDAPKIEIEIDKNKIREEFLRFVYGEIKFEGYSSGAFNLYDELQEKINASDEEKKDLYQKQLKIFELEEKQTISNKGLQTKFLLAELQTKLQNKKGVEVVKNRCKSILVCKYLENFIDGTEEEFVNRFL